MLNCIGEFLLNQSLLFSMFALRQRTDEGSAGGHGPPDFEIIEFGFR